MDVSCETPDVTTKRTCYDLTNILAWYTGAARKAGCDKTHAETRRAGRSRRRGPAAKRVLSPTGT